MRQLSPTEYPRNIGPAFIARAAFAKNDATDQREACCAAYVRFESKAEAGPVIADLSD
jgi:hypothetical protein